MCLIERLRFLDDIQQCILEDVNITFHKVTPSMFVAALAVCDPKRPEALVLEALEHMYGHDAICIVYFGNFDPEIPIINRFDASPSFLTPDAFFKRLMQLNWVRFSRRKALPF